MTVTQMAAYFGVAPLQVYRWIKHGKLKTVPHPRGLMQYVARREDVEAFKDDHIRACTRTRTRTHA